MEEVVIDCWTEYRKSYLKLLNQSNIFPTAVLGVIVDFAALPEYLYFWSIIVTDAGTTFHNELGIRISTADYGHEVEVFVDTWLNSSCHRHSSFPSSCFYDLAINYPNSFFPEFLQCDQSALINLVKMHYRAKHQKWLTNQMSANQLCKSRNESKWSLVNILMSLIKFWENLKGLKLMDKLW